MMIRTAKRSLLTIAALFTFGNLCGFAQKAPKGKLISYYHSDSNPEIPHNFDFKLTWEDGKGTLKIKDNYFRIQSYSYAAEVDEELFQQVADFIKAKKLYAIGKKKKKSKPGSIPYADPCLVTYTIQYEDQKIHANLMDMSLEQRDAFRELEAFVKQRSLEYLTANQLLKYEHSMDMKVLPPDTPDNYLYQLESVDGKATLKVNTYGDSPVVNVPQDVFEKVFNQFHDGHLYEPDSIFINDVLKLSAQVEESTETVSFSFKNGKIIASNVMQEKHGKPIDTIDIYLRDLYDEMPVGFPEGRMTYCSCAYTNHGLPEGEIHHSYYELIADEGTTPKVIYSEQRVGEHESTKTEYQATEQDVNELSAILRDKNIFKINGYHVERQVTGGTSYRIYMEFASGEKLEASWNNYDAPVNEAYSIILKRLKTMTER